MNDSEKTPLKTEELIINMGPQHPSTHGVLKIIITTDGEIVKSANPEIGFLHRCMEKHCENVNWLAVTPYVDRLDYIASMNNSLGYALTVEKFLGIEIPERAEYIRVIMAELQRIASHLLAIGTYGLDLGAFTPFLYAFRDREKILDIFELCSGGRLLYNYIWIGGVARDMSREAIEKTRNFIDYFKPKIKEYNELLSFNEIFLQRTKNIGILSIDNCFNYGITGVPLRAAGYKWDLRKNVPYSIYDKLEFDIPTGTIGDCWDRHIVRMNEMEQSLRIISQLLKKIPEGPYRAKLPKIIKVPAGEGHMRTECPRGELFFYIESSGDKFPYRVKCKSPCFLNISSIPELAPGMMVADLVAYIGSLDIVLGEVDR